MPTEPLHRAQAMAGVLLRLRSDRRIRKMAAIAATVFVGLLFYLGGKHFAVGLFPPPYDKPAPLAAFGALAGLLWIGLPNERPVTLSVMVTLAGAMDEWHQHFLPGRSADVYDLLPDHGTWRWIAPVEFEGG